MASDVAETVDMTAVIEREEEPWVVFAKLLPWLPLSHLEKQQVVWLASEAMRRIRDGRA